MRTPESLSDVSSDEMGWLFAGAILVFGLNLVAAALFLLFL